jgi:dipeptidyl aminopeptidase/acylaminoacyl peptidase
MATTAVFGVIACVLLTGAAFCARTLHVQRLHFPDPPGTIKAEVAAADGVKLSGALFLPDRSNGNCVIVLHGIAAAHYAVLPFAPWLLDQGYSVLTPDSRAHGVSGGALVTYGLLEKYDALAWAHWMRNRGCQRIYGLGESLGGSVLIQAAALEPAFSAIVADSPFGNLVEVGEYRVRRESRLPSLLAAPLAWFALTSGMTYARVLYRFDFHEVDPIQSIARSRAPILLIHGLSDSRVPASQSQELALASEQASLWLVPGADHLRASVIAPVEFRHRVLDWFAKH